MTPTESRRKAPNGSLLVLEKLPKKRNLIKDHLLIVFFFDIFSLTSCTITVNVFIKFKLRFFIRNNWGKKIKNYCNFSYFRGKKILQNFDTYYHKKGEKKKKRTWETQWAVISVYLIFGSSWGGNNSKAEIIFLWAIDFPNIKCTATFQFCARNF
jgi:hypothetical protein